MNTMYQAIAPAPQVNFSRQLWQRHGNHFVPTQRVSIGSSTAIDHFAPDYTMSKPLSVNSSTSPIDLTGTVVSPTADLKERARSVGPLPHKRRSEEAEGDVHHVQPCTCLPTAHVPRPPNGMSDIHVNDTY